MTTTEFIKKGYESAGVKRQYSGTAGKVENCQVGVFLYYSAPCGGGAFLDRELYLPEDWIEDWERCDDAGVPKDMPFRTKPDQARIMLERARAAGFQPEWTLGDTVYGSDPGLRRALEDWEWPYVMAIKTTESVRPRTDSGLIKRTAVEVARDLPADRWRRLSAGDGTKGPRTYDWATERLLAPGKAGHHTLLVRRSLTDREDIALFLVFTPQLPLLEDMVRGAGLRWTIEAGFESAKGEVGLDHYEVRQWIAWYRHITLALIAHALLAVIMARAAPAEKKNRDDPAFNMVPLSIPEIRVLLGHLVLAVHRSIDFVIGWSNWRRWHQAIARRCHIKRKIAQIQKVPLEYYTQHTVDQATTELSATRWSTSILLNSP